MKLEAKQRLVPCHLHAATGKEAAAFVEKAAKEWFPGCKVKVDATRATNAKDHPNVASIVVAIKTKVGNLEFMLRLGEDYVWIDGIEEPVLDLDDALANMSTLDDDITGKGKFKALDKSFAKASRTVRELQDRLVAYQIYLDCLHGFLGALEKGSL